MHKFLCVQCAIPHVLIGSWSECFTLTRTGESESESDLPGASAILPFVRLFYGRASTFVWSDDSSTPHCITQAEGGGQGDPLMPALFAVGVAPALASLQHELLPVKASVRSWAMTTLRASRAELRTCWPVWSTTSLPTPTFASTPPRRECGTQEGSSQLATRCRPSVGRRQQPAA